NECPRPKTRSATCFQLEPGTPTMFATERAIRPAAFPFRAMALLVLAFILVLALYPLGRYIWATVHYQRALSAIDRRDFSDAHRHLAICWKEWPNGGQPRFLAARTAGRAGQWKESQQLLKDAERLGWVPEAIELERGLLAIQLGGFQAVYEPLMRLVRENH